jgi:hypothetical protein
MITEKAIADDSWCPILWLEPTGRTKRTKEDRDWDPLEEIHGALSVGEKNRKAVIETTPLGRKALPYGEEFWLHIPFGSGKFLITCASISLEPLMGPESTIKLLRQPLYDPRISEAEVAETNLQILIAYHLKKFFTSAKHVLVTTQYPTAPAKETSSITPEQVSAAQEWGEEILGHAEGARPLIPNHDRCPRCWYRECGSRKARDTTPIVKMKPGQTRTVTSLD